MKIKYILPPKITWKILRFKMVLKNGPKIGYFFFSYDYYYYHGVTLII